MQKRVGVSAGMALLAGLSMTVSSLPAAAADTSSDRGAAPEAAQISVVDQALQTIAQHPAAAKRVSEDSFEVLRVLADQNGSAHVRMRRVHQGIPVIGGQLIIHNGPKGQFGGISTAIERPLTVSTDPAIPADQATEVAKHQAAGTIAETAEPHLVIDASGEPRLAWHTVVTGTKPDGQTPSALHVVVDALTGGVIDTWNDVHSAEGKGEGTYNGQVTFQTTESGGGYEMVDPQHGNGATRDSDNGGQVYTDSDNVWSDTDSVDVHYGVGNTYDYFAATHGFKGPGGDGNGISRNVHVNQPDYCNAFYDGSSINFGDCNGNSFTGIDIAAHEFSHGVTDNTASLRYNNSDAGGLNESTSDIFATLVEFHASSAGDTPDYTIGETVGDVFDREALRYLYDPKQNPNQFACYEPERSTDPHFSSGVGNHFFYLLVQGSNPADLPASPTCDGSTLDSGIGNDKGGKIWFRALSRYMGPSETYPEAAEATVRAAEDLYGACGPEYQQVQQAWAAVSIDGVGQTCAALQPASSRHR